MTDLGHSSNVLGIQQATKNRPHNFKIVAEVRAPPGLQLFAFVPCEAETRSVESCGSAVISNLLQGIETRATYDAGSQQFIVNTPNHEASKFWIGGAGQHGKVCTVFAQLTVDGKWQGPHVFVVRIRDDAGGCIYPCLSWSRMSTPWWLETPDTSHGWPVPWLLRHEWHNATVFCIFGFAKAAAQSKARSCKHKLRGCWARRAGKLMPGVRILDNGPKAGLNGVDNGD